jgi:methyltransferase (TIGR00027 family)
MTEKRILTAPSSTAQRTCLLRAISSLEGDKYFRSGDNLAVTMLPDQIQFLLKVLLFRAIFRRVIMLRKGMYEYVIARTKYFDMVFRKALIERFDQILIFGAGLDTRAFRFKNDAQQTRIFEIDALTTQQAKLKRFQESGLGLPSNVNFVDIDFDKENLDEKMDGVGYKRGLKSLFILEGLLMYLEPDSAQKTFRFIQQYAGKGSLVVFDYIRSSVLRYENTLYGEKGLVQSVSGAGEPWKFGLEPHEVKNFLADFDFRIDDHRDAHELEMEYFQDKNGNLRSRVNGTHCIVTAIKQ